MILHLLTWRPSSAGDGTETLSFRYWCGDLGSRECDDCCPGILQMISYSVIVYSLINTNNNTLIVVLKC